MPEGVAAFVADAPGHGGAIYPVADPPRPLPLPLGAMVRYRLLDLNETLERLSQRAG